MFYPNDRLAYPLYEVIAEAGLPALFHTGQTGIGAGTRGGGGIRLKYSNPMYVDDVAVDFPNRLGEYELLEEIGRGGMGIIFKARHERLHRLVAIKMILRSQVASPRNLDRFRIEAAATAHRLHLFD